MELYIFARFHSRAREAEAVAAVLREVIGPTRAEPGCLAIEVFQATRDPRLFFLHSRWIDEAAFDAHAELPHTVRFLKQMHSLIDHPLDIVRTRALG